MPPNRRGKPAEECANEIIGTLILIGIGSIIALPVGLMTGIFLSEFGSPKIASMVRFVADILAGVPSIVVGVFAYAIVVRPMHSYSAISAGVALAIIMIPVVARTAEEAMRLVPNSMREAALALGITRWRSVIGVVVPGSYYRDRYRDNAGCCPHRRRDCASYFYGLGQLFWL